MSADKGFLGVAPQNGSSGVVTASKHNKRKLPSHAGANPALSHLNYSLRGPETPEQVAELAKKLMSDAGITKLKRKDAITAIEFVASLPVGSNIDSTKYFQEFVEFIEGRFGAQNMLSADVHLDESAPHCHILISSLDGNKLNGSAIIGGKTKLSDLNACFYADVASKYGISRPPPRLSGDSKRAAAKLVRDRLMEDSDAAMVSSIWDVICKSIEQFPEPYMEALDIQKPALVKPVKTFKQIAIGTGKGPNTEAGQASRDRHLTRLTSTPIVVGGSPDARPLSCVGVAQFPSPFPPYTDRLQSTEAEPTAVTCHHPEAYLLHPSEVTPPAVLPVYLETTWGDSPEDWYGGISEHLAFLQHCHASSRLEQSC